MKECFVLVGGINCFGVIVPSSSHITRLKLRNIGSVQEIILPIQEEILEIVEDN